MLLNPTAHTLTACCYYQSTLSNAKTQGFMLSAHTSPGPYWVFACLGFLDLGVVLGFYVFGQNLDLPRFVAHRRADFLWEDTCFECFFGKADGSYVELNLAPDGRYALYQFNDYRTPNQLPPMPLATQALPIATLSAYTLNEPKDSTLQALERTPIFYKNPLVALRVVILPHAGCANALIALDRIQPCVIIKDTQQSPDTLYYAPYHANPPDFHQQKFWQTYIKKTAIKPFLRVINTKITCRSKPNKYRHG